MDDLEQIIKKIPVHVTRWNTFAIVAPPLFLTVGLALLMSDVVAFGTIFWIGVSIMAVTAFVWWVWVIHAIFRLIQYTRMNNKNINKAIDEILDIRKDLTATKDHGKSDT
jgi:hypothetical protein